MKINLEDKGKIRRLLPGYCQLGENTPFTPCVFAIGDEEIFIYDDFSPDEMQRDEYVYRVKKRIALSEIKTVLDEKIKKNKQLNCYNRLNLLTKAIDDSSYLYYLKKDGRLVKQFLKLFKKAGIRHKKVRVDLGPNC